MLFESCLCHWVGNRTCNGGAHFLIFDLFPTRWPFIKNNMIVGMFRDWGNGLDDFVRFFHGCFVCEICAAPLERPRKTRSLVWHTAEGRIISDTFWWKQKHSRTLHKGSTAKTNNLSQNSHPQLKVAAPTLPTCCQETMLKKQKQLLLVPFNGVRLCMHSQVSSVFNHPEPQTKI